MTEERIDALIRRLDVASSPDPGFVSSTLAILRPRVRAARVEDLSHFARVRGYLTRSHADDPVAADPATAHRRLRGSSS